MAAKQGALSTRLLAWWNSPTGRKVQRLSLITADTPQLVPAACGGSIAAARGGSMQQGWAAAEVQGCSAAKVLVIQPRPDWLGASNLPPNCLLFTSSSSS